MAKPKLYITTTIAPTLFFFSGQPRRWSEQFDVCAISAEKDRLKVFAQQEKIRYKYLPMHREISLIPDIICLLRFLYLFAKDRPYIVHGNTPKASILSMVAAWITRRPVRIYMCHGLRYQTTTGLLYKVLTTMERISCWCATEVICVSNGVRDQLIKDGLCKAIKAKVIRNGTAGGIDVNRFSPDEMKGVLDKRIELGIDKKSFVFIFVGRIVGDKGINELIHSFYRLAKEGHDVHLVLVGSLEKELDPISSETLQILDTHPRIHAVGTQADVRPFLIASDAFVLPSYREGVGMVLLEANAMGVPCIASDIIGCHDVIEDGVNGELVRPRDADALYHIMKRWYTDKEHVKNLASNCREYVVSKYSSADVKNAYYEEYKRLADASVWGGQFYR